MNASATHEVLAALSELRASIAVSIPWEVLHRWAGSDPLTVEHYAQIEQLWGRVWQQADPASAPPTAYLYHGAAKLTLVRETTQEDPPAIALADLAALASPECPQDANADG